MRVALISDIHGNLWALDAVLADIERHGVDEIWNLGDILSGPLLPAETADRLIALDLLTIRGNHERQLLACAERPGTPSDQYAFEHTTPRHHDWLRDLPATARPRPGILLCHGTPDDDLSPLAETQVPGGGLRLATAAECRVRIPDTSLRLVACGHTHLPRVVRVDDTCVVVNPGSVGLQAYDEQIDGQTYYRDNGTPLASYAIVDDHAGPWHVTLLRIPYDHTAAASLAATNARPDWAHALRTGYALRA